MLHTLVKRGNNMNVFFVVIISIILKNISTLAKSISNEIVKTPFLVVKERKRERVMASKLIFTVSRKPAVWDTKCGSKLMQ